MAGGDHDAAGSLTVFDLPGEGRGGQYGIAEPGCDAAAGQDGGAVLGVAAREKAGVVADDDAFGCLAAAGDVVGDGVGYEPHVFEGVILADYAPPAVSAEFDHCVAPPCR